MAPTRLPRKTNPRPIEQIAFRAGHDRGRVNWRGQTRGHVLGSGGFDHSARQLPPPASHRSVDSAFASSAMTSWPSACRLPQTALAQ